MAEDPAELAQCKARCLDLLRSGNFTDVEIVCGERSWKCHRAILTSRSVWFHKALSGPFQEASSRRVNLDEETPVCIDLALQYIYGGGLDIKSAVDEEHFMEHCVALRHTADFLLLNQLKSSVDEAVRSYCDKRLKQLCTIGNVERWRHKDDQKKLSPWALDVVLGIREAYKWNIEDSKKVLMEFIWSARISTLRNDAANITFDCLKDTPTCVTDLLGYYASGSWLNTAVWAPRSVETYGNNEAGSPYNCVRCGKAISWGDSEAMKGQVVDPFLLDRTNKITRGWCRDCGELDMIPWRN